MIKVRVLSEEDATNIPGAQSKDVAVFKARLVLIAIFERVITVQTFTKLPPLYLISLLNLDHG